MNLWRYWPVLVLAALHTAHAADIPRPHIPAVVFKITDYGAIGDGTTMNTDAITKTIDACVKAGGGSVVVPAGRFLTGPITLASNLDLHLDKDATLLISNKIDDFPKDKRGYQNEIVAEGCHDLSITGEGTIDGQGAPWWKEFLKTKNAPANDPHMLHRPFMIVIRDCTRLLVQGVTLTNSPSFHLVPQACHDVVIDHVQFIAPANAPNTDALDPSGWNFLISRCTFDVGDDCIAIKASGKAPEGHLSCENFLVTDCDFKHGHGMSIGGQTPGGLRHLIVRDSRFENTDIGIRMKANRGSGGLVEDCIYENLMMKDVKTPIYISSYYPERETPKSAKDDPAQAVNATTPIWRAIRINHLTATGARTAGKIIGLTEMPISDIELKDVDISAEKPMSIWNARGIYFIDSQIKVAAKEPAIQTENTSDITGIDTESGKAE
jgi:polygalacturonase